MADFKEVRDRAFALSGAILFFVTSIALTVVVIAQIIQENNQKKQTANTAVTDQKPQAGKLQGTKLAGFTPVASVTEIQSTDLTPGTGAEITSVDNTITADYTGALAKDGTIFESSLDAGQPFTRKLSEVIPGWQTGMIGMKEGGKRRLVIPAAQAYGEQATGSIPANSDLVFDITLQKVAQ
ncbi:MAG TPA: FKBP-type peptidyl-prolyl cis-trans isomerase [Candidatus Saccharimonadales bacterium]